MAATTTRDCPFCKTTIAASAVVCPKCGDRTLEVARAAAAQRVRSLLLAVLLAVSAIAAAVFSAAWYFGDDDHSEQPNAVVPTNRSAVKVLAAKQNLPTGIISGRLEDYFVEVECPQDRAPNDALTKNDLPGCKFKDLKRPMAKGEVLRATDLQESHLSPLQRMVASGELRTVTVPCSFAWVNEIESVIGAHADVLWIGFEEVEGRRDVKVLVEDVLILELGQWYKISRDVTLAVSPEDAAKVTEACLSGELRLVLCELEEGRGRAARLAGLMEKLALPRQRR
jgi:Flp pilus assembly protein CpaB